LINWLSTNENVLQTLGMRLKAFRIAAGYSQQKLAETCGVSVPVIGRMENGDGGVKFVTWIDALRVLGKLQNLEMLLPDDELTPYDYVEAVRPKRQRAPRSDRKIRKIEWKWGSDGSGR